MFLHWICWYIKSLYIGYVGTLTGKSLGRLSSLIVDCNHTNPFVGLILKSEQQIDTIPTTEYSKNDGQQLKLNSKSCLAQNKNLSPPPFPPHPGKMNMSSDTSAMILSININLTFQVFW